MLSDEKLNEIMNEFADGGKEIALMMSKDGFWLRVAHLGTWQITGSQADKVLIAMRCMRAR